jgi:hypothetical protein
VGYVRVSTFEQNAERQLGGVTLDRTFTDKAPGKDTKRPQLDALPWCEGNLSLARPIFIPKNPHNS